MNTRIKHIIMAMVLGLLWVSGAFAQAVPPLPPAQFDMTGYIQEATVDGTVAGTATTPLPNTDVRAGGTVTLNGIKMLVPNNTIVQMPAGAFTWQQLFDPAVSAPVGVGTRPNHAAGQTGMAIVDNPRIIMPACEIRVVGNISPNAVTGAPQYIVGLIVPISGELLNVVSGIINHINYANGSFRVGGVIGNPNSGCLVQINDPVGRFGKIHSRDQRFTCDTNNPTISAATGYPVGIPRFDPAVQDDPLWPIANRPVNDPLSSNPDQPFDPFLPVGAFLKTWTMPAPGGPPGTPDPTQQVPLKVGDWVDVNGTLFKMNPSGPNTANNWFIHAHTLVANLGIYTQPGVKPAYINAAVLIGTGGNPVTAGTPPTTILQENSTRITTEGFCTDPSNIVNVYAIDVNPTSGAETLRLLGQALPEAGPSVGVNRPKGRWRFIVGKGPFTPVTREYIAKTLTGQMDNVANGLTAGQYRLPCFDYIGAEGTIMGGPIVPFNFQEIPFLAQGSGPLNGTGPILGRLDPWPGP